MFLGSPPCTLWQAYGHLTQRPLGYFVVEIRHLHLSTEVKGKDWFKPFLGGCGGEVKFFISTSA